MSERLRPPFAILRPGDPFPDYGSVTEAQGPLAIGGDLSTATLKAAYSRGIFPWFSEPPVLWWSLNPRMVLRTEAFRLHTSLRKTITRLHRSGRLLIRMDYDVASVLAHCAHIARPGQDGTWLNRHMQRAYLDWHAAGHVHSVETWLDGQLAGGLYCVNIGQAVFGESMFSLQRDASKIALAALVAFCRKHGIGWIDCQQNTPHLASLGAGEIQRTGFLHLLRHSLVQPAPIWQWAAQDWRWLTPTITDQAL
ncbi:leucyl/phenylalanyl-tRNA--protein transferase [Comamonadaceae bacterium OH3737_COT-264]|nr:leucyl/phenylalanyl-tRNA--protein transferase [Comamonadaceae bacterium OH3737_COT-264]